MQIKKLHPEAKLPAYAYEGDAGMDLFTVEDYTLKPGEQHIFPTGVAILPPRGFAALIWDKSGLSLKHGIKTMGGVFDSNYTGEFLICLLNTSSEPYEFKKGDKICQVLIQPTPQATIEEVNELPETVRGDKRHGSSGK